MTKVDEAQCMGVSPTASDRILAKQIALNVRYWVESNEETGMLILQDNKAIFKKKH
jgi:hypothetical protein